MPEATTHHVSHHIEVDAPAERVLNLLVDASRWPLILGPTLHVDYLAKTPTDERLHIWARANDDVRSWESHRHIDADAWTVDFEQVTPAPPAAAMSGCWTVEPGEELATRLVLAHSYAAIDDDPAGLQWIAEATDRNSTAELQAMKTVAESLGAFEEATFTFEDEIPVDGSADDVYTFLFEGEAWPERLAHVSEVRLSYHDHDVQGLGMDTVAPDGSTHTTHSYRVCQRPHAIAYKQTETPPLMHAHTGLWTIRTQREGVSVASRHSVTINREAIAAVLGPTADLDDARDYVRSALSANSMKTLLAAQAWAEARSPASAARG